MKIIETKRLILRTWEPLDLEPMVLINQDPLVMEYFPSLQDRDKTQIFINRMNQHFKTYGYTLYAVQTQLHDECIGFIGLLNTHFDTHFTPAIEIGWRLSSKQWGKGYATEGALAVLKQGFIDLELDEIVSFTVAKNTRSRRVMEKLGLKHNPSDDFDHPKVAQDSPCIRHVLYRLKREEYFHKTHQVHT